MEGFIDIKVFDLVKTFEKTFNSLNKKLASQQIKFGLINLLPRKPIMFSKVISGHNFIV